MDTKQKNSPEGSVQEDEVRVKVTVNNKTGTDVKLLATYVVKGRNLFNPATWEGWQDGYVLESGQSMEMWSVDNDRMYAQFEALKSGKGTGVTYRIGMTVPKSSHNSAAGWDGLEGLQKYERGGTPASFTFNFGNPNIASWNSGDSLDSSGMPDFGNT